MLLAFFLFDHTKQTRYNKNNPLQQKEGHMFNFLIALIFFVLILIALRNYQDTGNVFKSEREVWTTKEEWIFLIVMSFVGALITTLIAPLLS